VPEEIGKKVKGSLPVSHYGKHGNELSMANRRHFCTLCHVPQADVNTLVDISLWVTSANADFCK
jgi:nitrate reductase cytochrome c-type subunit